MDGVVGKDSGKGRGKGEDDENCRDNEGEVESKGEENGSEKRGRCREIMWEKVDGDKGKVRVWECEKIGYWMERRRD